MALIALVQLLSRASLVDAHHGYADGPGGFANAQAQVAVIGVDVSAFLSRFDNLHDGLEDAVFQVAFFKLAEKLL